jgi:hypothetical protein
LKQTVFEKTYMNLQFGQKKIFTSLRCGRALRTVVLLLMSVFFCCNVFTAKAQNARFPASIQLLDTINVELDLMGSTFMEITCLNTTDVFEIKLLVQRYPTATNDSSWASQNVVWTFPSSGWHFSQSNPPQKGPNGENGWDTITFRIDYNLLSERGAVKGGQVTAHWVNSSNPNDTMFVATAYIPLRPATGPVDTIYIEPPFCEGQPITARINLKNRTDTNSYFDPFFQRMYFAWRTLDADGKPLSGNRWTTLTPGGNLARDTVFTISNFNPSIHKGVSVQRVFCNPQHFDDITYVTPQTYMFEGAISNPPLDTASVPREDTLYRLAWVLGDEGAFWSPITMLGEETPACVNYERAAHLQPTGFVYSKDPHGEINISTGYLFFQVGTKQDTTVRYIWDYDTALLERVYVNVPTKNGTQWWLMSNDMRWSTLMGDPIEDEDTKNNLGWFGHPSADSTYRAVFRIKALSEERRAEHADTAKYKDSIVVSVRPVCLLCENANGTPFQNRLLTGNVGKPWDTTKPMNDFYVEIIMGGGNSVYPMYPNYNNPLSPDTACDGTMLYFRAVPNPGSQRVWNADSMLSAFNITGFSGWGFSDIGTLYQFTNTDGMVTGYADCSIGIINAPDVRPLFRTFTGTNACFMRRPPTVFVDPENKYQLNSDLAWHQLSSFFAQRIARAPYIIDPTTGNALGPSDTIYICKNPVMDSTGEGLRLGANGLPIQGVNYILRNDSGRLMANPPGLGKESLITPSNGFHGFFNLIGEEGSPAGIGWDFQTLDSLSTQVWFWLPSGYSGEDSVLIFAAQDMCGKGDPLVVSIAIIDTVSTQPPVIWTETLLGNTEILEHVPENPCENTSLLFRITNIEEPIRRTFTHWWYPDSWTGTGSTFYDPEKEETFIQQSVTFGRDTGMLSVNMINRCGGSKRIFSPIIKPIPYYRADWNEFRDEVCQDSIYTYSLNKEPEKTMSDLYIRFPNDWKVLANIEGTFREPKDNKDTVRGINLDALKYDDVFFRTRAGEESGDILVRWLVNACDVGANARPEYWDTSKVFVHTYPIAPEPRWKWQDTVCLRDTIWLSVKPAPKDSLQDNYYVWTLPNEGFPNGWQKIEQTPKGDSVRVVTGVMTQLVDTIFVQAMSSACHEKGGGILKMPVMTWDTAAFDMSLILDALTGTQFGNKPCEGDTLKLFVNKPYLVDSVDWWWTDKTNDWTNQAPGDLTMSDWWRFADTDVLPDTLMFYPESGKPYNPLYVRVGMRNQCGWNYSPEIQFDVSPRGGLDALVPTFSAFDAEVCFGAEGYYEIDTTNNAARYADRFIWHFPWSPFTDTTFGNNSRTMTPTELGNVSVVAMNSCSKSNSSVPRAIAQIKSAPRAPVPINFGKLSGTELVDTVCKRKDYDWMVAANPDDMNDGLDLQPFIWLRLGGDTLSTPEDLFDQTLSVNNDIVRIKGVAGEEKRTRTYLGITARQVGCDVNGDTLKVTLISADTIPLADLGNIVMEPLPICTDGIVKVFVQNNLAFAYRWILPEGYEFQNPNPTEQAKDTVYIRVGTESAQIGVKTITGPNVEAAYLSQNYCPYENSSTHLSNFVELYPRPVLNRLVLAQDTVCAGTQQTASVLLNLSSHADAYRFILHRHVANSSKIDDTTWVQSSTVYTFTSNDLPDWAYDSITVKVIAIDSTCAQPLYSDTVARSFVIFNSPKVFLNGNMTPCPDSSIVYLVQLSDSYVIYTFSKNNSPGVIVDDQLPYIYVDFFGDSVQFRFDNIRHGYCSHFNTTLRDTVFSIHADTLLTIDFSVTPILPDLAWACMGDTLMFYAEKSPLHGFNVSFVWDISTTSEAYKSWEINRYIGKNQDTVVLVAPDYINRETRIDTLLVYAVGSCGISKDPKKLEIQIDSLPIYDIKLYSDFTDFPICEKSMLTVWADTSGFNLGDMWVRWNYSNVASIQGGDLLTFEVPKGDFTLYARFFVDGTCGYSAPVEFVVDVDNLPAPLQFAQNTWPCQKLPLELSVVPDPLTNYIEWDTIGPAPLFTVHTSSTGYSLNDSLYFGNVDTLPFQLIGTAYNHCGSRQDTIAITPSERILPLGGGSLQGFDFLRYCSDNTVIGSLKIPFQHVNTNPEYFWTFPDGWLYIKDSIVGADTVNMVWFIPGETQGSISVWADSKTGCGVTDTVSTDVSPTILYLKASQSTDTTTYKNTSVFFHVEPDNVGIVGESSTADDFNFTWTPANRFTYSTHSDTARLTYAYLTTETFVVRIQENAAGLPQQCVATDTVYLHVVGSYQFTVQRPDSVCKNSIFPMEILHTGGEPTTNRQQWFRYDPDGGMFVEFNRTDMLVEEFMSAQDSMLYKVVGLNTLFGNPEGTIQVPISDTLHFSIKAVPPISAKIIGTQIIQIIGNKISVVRTLRAADSVKLGEKLRFFGGVDGRSENFAHYVYEWLTFEDLYGFDPDKPFEYAGYVPNRIDTAVAYSGLIFHSQPFYFAVEDTSTYGCLSMDSIYIKVFTPTGSTSVDFGRVPGAFSPSNNDGTNDVFMKEVDEITILNRWGVTIYESKNKQGWDGRDSKSKRMVDPGDYFYIITIYENNDSTKKHTKTGVVTVL